VLKTVPKRTTGKEKDRESRKKALNVAHRKNPSVAMFKNPVSHVK
jgi:hypothetical protein